MINTGEIQINNDIITWTWKEKEGWTDWTVSMWFFNDVNELCHV